jgi:hypothetical protein
VVRSALIAATLCAPMLLATCAGAQQESTTPAVLTSADPEVHAELAAAVAGMFGGIPVPIADDALTQSPVLVLERVPRAGPDGLLADGRKIGRPDFVRLLRVGARCVLVDDRTGQRRVLQRAQCRPQRDSDRVNGP